MPNPDAYGRILEIGYLVQRTSCLADVSVAQQNSVKRCPPVKERPSRNGASATGGVGSSGLVYCTGQYRLVSLRCRSALPSLISVFQFALSGRKFSVLGSSGYAEPQMVAIL
jgi:hypothetical protein